MAQTMHDRPRRHKQAPADDVVDMPEVDAAERERRAAETDALLDEIDDLLATDGIETAAEAQTFVSQYIQKGGE